MKWITGSLLSVLALGLFACSEEPAPESPIVEPLLHTDPAGPINITLTPLDTEGAAMTIGALKFISGYVLSADHDTFGGLSGLAITKDDRMMALQDVGLLVTARMDFEAETEKLIGLSAAHMSDLLGVDGKPLNPPPYDSEGLERCPSSTADVFDTRATIGQHDSEGIEVAPDGSLYVSFERHHRIVHYVAGGASLVPLPEEILHAPCNAGLEAITVLPSGDLLVLSEGIHNEDQSLKAWLVSADGSSELRYPYMEGFRPTGLAVLPNGDALVVERFFTPAIGNKSRILRIPAASIVPGASLDPIEIAFLDGQNFPIDNLEGIAVRTTSAGATDIFLVSDHNFSPERQRTLLLQFRIASDL